MKSSDSNSQEFTIKTPYLSDQEKIGDIRYYLQQILNAEHVSPEAKEALLSNEQVQHFIKQYGLGE